MTAAYRAEHLIDAREARRRAAGLAFLEVAPWKAMAEGPDPITGSIPGAFPTAITSDFAGVPTETSGHLPLPERATLQRRIAGLGIGPHDEIVVYTRRIEELSSATRAWFTLTWAGYTAVRVLDGGLPAWVAAGGATGPPGTPGAPARDVPPANGREGGGLRVLGVAEVLDISRYGTLLDARPASAYDGARDDPRSGHVPHAVHAPWTALVAGDGRLLPPTELRRWLLARRAIGGHDVGAYCGGGVGSSVLVFAGALLGQEIGLYVDSWSAWRRDESLPVEQGASLTRSEAVDADCA